MGSRSRSRSSQATKNSSTTFGIQGANNGLVLNGSGNTVTDGGAFKIVGDMADMLPQLFRQGAGMVTDGLNAVTDVAMMRERQTTSVLNTANDLFLESNSTQREMMRLNADALTETGEILSRGVTEGYDFGRTVISSNADVSTAAMTTTSRLAETLTLAALTSNNENTKNTGRQLNDGFKSMMNFAEDFSRSDSVAAAKNSNQTVLYVGGGLILVAIAVMFKKGKK